MPRQFREKPVDRLIGQHDFSCQPFLRKEIEENLQYPPL